MSGQRYKLRVLFLALCAAQLVVTGLGLAVAYQVLHSYSLEIDYEQSANSARRTVAKLDVLAREASPETLALDDDTYGPQQLSQIDYAAKLFLPKAQELLTESTQARNSPLVKSQGDIATLLEQMTIVRHESQLAGDAWSRHDPTVARAQLTYAERADSRVETALSNIDQEMLRAKDSALAKESGQTDRTQLILLPISVLGALMLYPALLYVRRVDEKILQYESELEDERNRLEERVTLRTSELQTEIDLRTRLETFNDKRNGLLEQVAEGRDLHGILAQLAQAAEQSVRSGQCLILLNGEPCGTAIGPSVPADVAVYLETILLRSWDTVATVNGRPCSTVLLRDTDAAAKLAFGDVWAVGYVGVFASAIADARSPAGGIVALLLRDSAEPDGFMREVLLSASRMASVALNNDRMQDELFRRAHQDSLTGLPNRALFEDRLEQALARARRGKSNVAVLCLDLDGFKEINDRYGHEAGDWLLREAALRLAGFVRKADTVARIGGDEFVAAVGDIREREDLAGVCRSINRILREPYSFGGVTFRTTASLGAAMFPQDGKTSEELRRNADLAMYRAKECGRDTYQLFSVDLGEKLARRRQMEEHLRNAQEHQGFEMHYQPICTLSRDVIGLEALIRFRSSELQPISPAEFMVVAEQIGQIAPIGEWSLRQACLHAREWQREGFPAVPVAVNVSPIQLGRVDFADRVHQILRETDLSPEWLHVEVTETAVMSNFEEGRRQLCALADLGVEISIDDFGTGHSSLSYLHCLPIKALKIDRSFVQRIVESNESKAIVRAIIAMAQSLELAVVAEGVETEEQLQAVAAAGCGAAQGYLFARPLNHRATTELLRNRGPRALDSVSPAARRDEVRS